MLINDLDIESDDLAELLRRTCEMPWNSALTVEDLLYVELDASPDAPHRDDVCTYMILRVGADGLLLVCESPGHGGVRSIADEEKGTILREIREVALNEYPQRGVAISGPLAERMIAWEPHE